VTTRAAAALGLVLLGLASTAGAQQSLGVRELAAEAPRILRELAGLRGLPATGPPPRVVIRTREERRQFILREFQRKFSTGRLDAERRAMVAWGLIPPDFDLAGFLAELVLEQATAYYDPVAKVMVLANWLPRDQQREALTHELVHLLQDRQVNLDRFLAAPPGRGDEALARQALVEGEAVALTLDRSLRRQGQHLALLPDVAALQQAYATSGTGPVLGRAPRFVRALLAFPYASGLGFVHRFRQRSGWFELSAVFADPPRSTAQILHPERYLERRVDPVPVALPDLAAVLGGGRLVLDDVAGEFVLAAVLREGLGEDAAALATGWRGDRYALWEDAAGTAVLVSLSAWPDEAAATAFADACARLLARKHGLPGAGAPAWEVAGRAFGVARRAAEVLLYERVPTGALSALRLAVWR
jgi:hypothetical protein